MPEAGPQPEQHQTEPQTADQQHKRGFLGLGSLFGGHHEEGPAVATTPALDQAPESAPVQADHGGEHEIASSALADLTAVTPGDKQHIDLSEASVDPAVAGESDHHEAVEPVAPEATSVQVSTEEASASLEVAEETTVPVVADAAQAPATESATTSPDGLGELTADNAEEWLEQAKATTGAQGGESVVATEAESASAVQVDEPAVVSVFPQPEALSEGAAPESANSNTDAHADGVTAASEEKPHPEAPETAAADAAIDDEGVQPNAEGSLEDVAQVREAQVVEDEVAQADTQPESTMPEAEVHSEAADSQLEGADMPTMPTMPIEPKLSDDTETAEIPILSGSEPIAKEVNDTMEGVGDKVVPESESAITPESIEDVDSKTGGAEVIALDKIREARETMNAALDAAEQALQDKAAA